jgi:hypothetical protein
VQVKSYKNFKTTFGMSYLKLSLSHCPTNCKLHVMTNELKLDIASKLLSTLGMDGIWSGKPLFLKAHRGISLAVFIGSELHMLF